MKIIISFSPTSFLHEASGALPLLSSLSYPASFRPCLCLYLLPSLSLTDIVSLCVAESLWTGWRCPGQTFASAATEWLNTRETNTTSPTRRGTASLSGLVLRPPVWIDRAAFVSRLHSSDVSFQLFHLHLRELWLCGAAKGTLSITCPFN